MRSLFGEEYDIAEESLDDVRSVIKRAKTAPFVFAAEKKLKSSKMPLNERLGLIEQLVYAILGKQRGNVQTIRTAEAFHDYISGAIAYGSLAVDTETNNSLDPLTCKLMGPCLYYPGTKQVYIPINHVNVATGERLPDQLTEDDCAREFRRLVEAGTKIIMHNAKFDYKVIKCTCGVELVADWDTLVAAKILDENEPAGLKDQYSAHIDPEQEKYSIDKLFAGVEYAQVKPELFALYAATDAYDTYRLYEEYQLGKMQEPGNERLYALFMDVEMPCVQVVAEMELTGVGLDIEYTGRLKAKYEAKLADVDARIQAELLRLKPQIDDWRLSQAANARDREYLGAVLAEGKTIRGKSIAKAFPHDDHDGKGRYRLLKSKAEQFPMELRDVNISSPAQMAILFYDILDIGVIDPEDPRGTGKEILDEVDLPIADLVLERKICEKLYNAFILALPSKLNPKTGKIHCSFHQFGAATGRFSSSDPSLQQIPSHEKSVRMMFMASCPEREVEPDGDCYEVKDFEEVLTEAGWKAAADVVVGDVLCGEATKDVVKSVFHKDGACIFGVC